MIRILSILLALSTDTKVLISTIRSRVAGTIQLKYW